ncbi:MAG: hypothetical protein JWN53_2222 [Gemmatimonadetes bacterium]|jgi:hypothetical protein|nr:hypothetical protein [Gemmatimonadota bacterium]
MPSYFPRQTIDWRAMEEPRAFRRLSLSLVEMALITGVVLRVLRALTFMAGRASWFLYVLAFLVGLLILVGMTTAHLANFSLRRWLWRAPVFALVETVGEMATSLLLIALRREPEGASRADFHDWPSMALRALAQNELMICLWVAVLAAVIVIVRRSGMARGVDGEKADRLTV